MTLAILVLACLVLAVAVVTLAVVLRRQRDEAARAVALLHAEHAAVQRRLSALEARALVEEVAQPPSRDDGGRSASPGLVTGAGAPSSTRTSEEFVITRLGDGDGHETAVEPPDARLFADLVLRESVVRVASLAHGVRRGLSPGNRNRIRFEMRREVKRARKDRKAEEREAIREWRARQRAAVRGESAA
jgi:hypothetical protein